MHGPTADHAQVVARDVGDGEAVRRGGRQREREAARAPAREALSHEVRRRDVEARAEEQLLQDDEVRLVDGAHRRADQARRAAGEQHDRDVGPAPAGRDLSDPGRGVERVASRERMVAAHRRRSSDTATARRRGRRSTRRRSSAATEESTSTAAAAIGRAALPNA